MQSYSPLQKDIVLRNAFGQLKPRGIDSAWSTSPQPFTDLYGECRRLMADATFIRSLSIYLRTHTTLPRAVEMLFTCMAMAAGARWDDAPEEMKGVRARGWFLGRWIPTFLIVDGPIGRFMTGDDSPLKRS
ncbi:MAG: hypothetical protein HY534_00295 [Chloroflexi bacterium]|nr:hypothetical protein [Chloroflexota bacterium]